MLNSGNNKASGSMVHDIEVGTRIECQSHYGTVKYVGGVNGYQAQWLGIDWDDATRGKHDGTVAGTKYFQASSATSGSFVRPAKINTGIDAIEAITNRYGRVDDKIETLLTKKELLNVQKEMNAPFLEMVGFEKVNEKQSNFHDLKVVSLRLQLVSSPGAPGKLNKMFPNICELDISKNLLNNWSDIFNICEQLKQLHWLNISENLLKMPHDTKGIVFPSMKTIICGYMKLTWNDILKISPIFPNVEEFRLPYNLITNIEIPTDHSFESLKLLDLEGNTIKYWSEFNKLGILSNLELLIVTNTSIEKIQFGPIITMVKEEGKCPIFENLKQLIISENLIDNWESISELNKLKNLQELKFLKNPILDTENQATCFQLIVARIRDLSTLNGTIIKPSDRKGAEYDYIKKHGLEWLSVKDNEKMKKQFLERHPRYFVLIKRHGEPEESELSSKAHSLKTSLTTVDIIHDSKIISKKLPLTMSVQKLVMLVQKLFHLPDRPVLCYISSERPDMEIEMNDEFKEIGFYSIQDGDRIFIK